MDCVVSLLFLRWLSVLWVLGTGLNYSSIHYLSPLIFLFCFVSKLYGITFVCASVFTFSNLLFVLILLRMTFCQMYISTFYFPKLLYASLRFHLAAVEHHSPRKICDLLKQLRISIKVIGSYNRTLWRNEFTVITDEPSGVTIIPIISFSSNPVYSLQHTSESWLGFGDINAS